MRLKSEIWVKAYLRRCTVNGANAVIVRHGDDDAGAIFIMVRDGAGQASLFAPAPTGLDGAEYDRRWVAALKGHAASEADVERRLQREAEFDEDVWIIEVDDRAGRHFLGDDLMP